MNEGEAEEEEDEESDEERLQSLRRTEEWKSCT